ncbi:MAG: hypothetical protein E7101_12625 [Prevotella ruminicola]|uniref:Uncharacterized protein n=1 Tax=Xylanibacter ruminicola TaxID=839 RepID=A0A9D5P2T5_XYLRU|nr:hypothetical protein [Xylanibacter ruminicola]
MRYTKQAMTLAQQILTLQGRGLMMLIPIRQNKWITNFAFSLKLNFLIFPLVAFYLRGFCVRLA